MLTTGACPPASVGWFNGKICRRALPTLQLGKTAIWLFLAASGEDAYASEQGAIGQVSAPAAGADGDGARGQRVQIFPCSCPAICDAEFGLLFVVVVVFFVFCFFLKKALLMDFSPMNLSNPFPRPCKLRLFQEQQVKHYCNCSLALGPAGREQHPPLQFIPLTLPMSSCPSGTALCKVSLKAVPRLCVNINLNQTYGRDGANKFKHVAADVPASGGAPQSCLVYC